MQPSSKLKITETIPKTGGLNETTLWYAKVLGVSTFFKHAPAHGTKRPDLGGQTRASDFRMCFFRLSLEFLYV
jgi:hypothetical protein